MVERDPIAGARIAAALEQSGYTVTRCDGPSVTGCPMLAGCGCTLVERSDVLVYGIADARFGAAGRTLLDELRALYGDHALVVVGSDTRHGPIEFGADHGVIRLRGARGTERLALAVEDALAVR